MNMKVVEEIKAENLVNLIYCLSTEACSYHGLEEDEASELTLGKFTKFLEEKAKDNQSIRLLTSD